MVHTNDIKSIRDVNIFSSTNILHTSPAALSLSYGILHIIISYALILEFADFAASKIKPDDEQPLVSNILT